MPSTLAALLVGTGVMLGSVLCYGMATALLVRLVVQLMRAGYTGPGFWKNVLVMMIVMLVTAAAHLTQIALWAVAYRACGEMATFEKAFYFSAENYTALGYGDVLLSERWRLLGPLEAMNGVLLFGLSTGMMFALLSRLVANHLSFTTPAAPAAGGQAPIALFEDQDHGKPSVA
jgi:hypothetical protein